MFRNLFKGFKKKDIELQKSKNDVEEGVVDQVEEESVIAFVNDVKDKSEIILQETEQSINEVSEQTNSSEVSQTAKRPAEILMEYKNFYKDKFIKCHNTNEVIDTYIRYTDYGDITNEFRLKYISMYLFNSNLSEEKFSIKAIKSLLDKRLLGFKKKDDELQELKNDVEEGVVDQVEEESVIAFVNDVKDKSEIILQETEQSINEVSEQTNSSEVSQTAKRPAEILMEYKNFYKDKFIKCHNTNEVIDTYIRYTDYGDITNEFRLKYISMYLFNSNLSEEKFSIKSIKSLLDKRLLILDNNKEIKSNTSLNEGLYIDVKEYIKNQINQLKQIENELDLDEIDPDKILITLFIKYEFEVINSKSFIEILTRIMKELNLSKLATNNDDVMNYLKLRVLNIVDIQFWREDEEKIYRCDAFFMGRHLLVKTKDFNMISSSTINGPIDVNVSPVDNSSSSYINITDNLFIAITADKDKIVDYFKYMNNELVESINQEGSIANSVVDNPSTELVTVIRNFMNILPLDFLLDKDNFIAFEHFISFHSFICQDSLDSDILQRDIIQRKLREDSNFSNDINSIYQEKYIKLVKVAGKYISIPEKYHSLVVWKLMKIISIEFVSEYWGIEYGIYFKNDTNTIDLDEYVDMYCRCLEIPTKNITPVGAFTYYLMKKKLFPMDINDNFVKSNIYLIDKIIEKIEEIELELFEHRLTNPQVQTGETYSINNVDLMNGYEFEKFISILFTKMGYMTEITKGSGDQGMDVIAERNGSKIGIQAKCYSSKVSNKAVQEIFASLNHYNCDKGIVVTNNYFTNSALELAKSNNVILWDRDILKSKIEEIFN